ncbi:hypothetical protein Agub_g2949, partial [Astrephomene gubernaculifera]
MSTGNPVQRNLDTAGLRRLQDLDRTFFGGGTGRSRPFTADDVASPQPSGLSASAKHAPWPASSSSGAGLTTGQLPPLMAAWPDPGTPSGAPGVHSLPQSPSRAHTHPQPHMHPHQQHPQPQNHGSSSLGASQRQYGTGTSQRPRTIGGNVANMGGTRRAANAKPPRRAGASLDPLTAAATAGVPNPWEAVMDAAPATRYSAVPVRSAGGLQLLMPSGSSREAMLSYEQRLSSYLSPMSGPAVTASVNNLSGSGTLRSMGGGGGGGGSPIRMSVSPTRAPPTSTGFSGGGSSHQASTLPHPPPPQPHATMHDLQSPQHGGSTTAAVHSNSSNNPSLPPLMPRTVLNASLAAPVTGPDAPWGGAGLPYNVHTSGVTDYGSGGGAGAAGGGLDGFGGGDGEEFWDGCGPPSPPLLGRLISGKPSSRRQVQLMADWLDNTIGMLWEHHVASAAASAASAAATAPAAAPAGKASPGGTAHLSDSTSFYSTAPPPGLPLEATSPPASQPWRFGLAPSAAGSGGGGSGGKAALAMRFGNVSAGLRDLSANLYGIATQPQLWAAMVEATSAVAHTVVAAVAQRCWEEGALLARLWNLHTALLDSGLAAARRSREALSATAAEQAAKIRRLDPLIDWELESRTAKESLTTALEASRAEALLAGRERDALLRENDKIIAYYRRELKAYKREQRSNAYRLARKLRNTQQQLELMTRDRDVLFSAVAYTKSQTGQLVDLISGMHGHLRAAVSGSIGSGPGSGGGSTGGAGGGSGGVSFAAALGDDGFPELQQIEQGLKNIQFSVTKVRDVNQDAEDSHFVVEEQVTAVAAADTVGDELVDEVLAEGDPEPSPEEAAAAAAMAAAQQTTVPRQDSGSDEYDSDDDPHSALSMMAEAALRGTGESSDEDDDEDDEEDEDEEEEEEDEEEDLPMVGVAEVEEIRPEEPLPSRGATPGSAGSRSRHQSPTNAVSTPVEAGSDAGTPAPASPSPPAAAEEGEATADRPATSATTVSDAPSTANADGDGDGDTPPGSAGDGGGGGAAADQPPADAAASGEPPAAGKKRRNRNKNKGGGRVSAAEGDGDGGGGDAPPGSAGGHPKRVFTVASASSQTGKELLKGVADPEITEAARHMGVLREALSEIGIMGNPNDDGDGTDGLLTALRQYMASLSQEAGQLHKQLDKLRAVAEAAEAARSELSGAVEARGREVAAVRRELLEAKKIHSQLCDALEAIGIDPRAPALPAHGMHETMDGSLAAAGEHGSRQPGRAEVKGPGGARDKSGGGADARRGGMVKFSKVAAAKEKARERAMAAASAPSQGYGRASTVSMRSAASGSVGGPPGRLQLPAAMLAAAQMRAAEAAVTGDGEVPGPVAAGGGAASGSGGGSVAATITAWRSSAAAATAGGGVGGPVPVYIRPDRAAATARLQDALTRYADVKPRTAEWLLKLIDAMYRGKATSDEQRSKMGQEPLTMIEYMFQHLSGVYGTKDLVNQYAAQLVATCLQYCAVDPRVSTFQRFLMEEWDTRVLCAYLDASRKLQEPTRVAACDFPPDYVPSGGRKGDSGPVDVRKALWVAEKVLLRRSPKAAYVFAQLLNSRAEPISGQEMDLYFVSPGSYGAELQQVRQFEMGRAEFKRVSSAVFLDALCGEYARMEVVFREVLPEIFSQYDNDADGWITRRDVASMVTDMAAAMAKAGMQLPYTSADAPSGLLAAASGGGGGNNPGAEADREGTTEALWAALLAAEADARLRADPGTVFPDNWRGGAGGAGGGGAAAAGGGAGAGGAAAGGGGAGGGSAAATAGITHVSDGGFVEGAYKSDFVRAWVRAFRTGAAMLPATGALAESDLQAARESARRLLAVVVSRHWAHHGAALEAFFADAGVLAEQQLRQQAAVLDGEMGGSHGDGRDGPRRAAALGAVLRLLLVKKADRFTALLTPDNLTGGPHNGPASELEELLSRLTAAVRLLYGPSGSTWVMGAEMDELAALSSLDAGDVEALPPGYKRWLVSVAVRCCALHDRLHLTLPPSPLLPQLQTHRGASHWARLWRKATAAAVAAKRRASFNMRGSASMLQRRTPSPGPGGNVSNDGRSPLGSLSSPQGGGGGGGGDRSSGGSSGVIINTPVSRLTTSSSLGRRPGSGST